MFAKIAFFCAALVAASAYAPLVNTGVSAVSNQQDAWGNYAYRYDIRDAATGSLNSKAEVGKVGAIAVAAQLLLLQTWVWAMEDTLPLLLLPVAYGGYSAPAVAARVAYGGALGHGAALGWGYGAGILGAGLGKTIL
ncbi:hypothetical protein CEXT_262081 [Caerostris extrusa]|uniref:Uncharacterized protein n=1 Tax=Caerostris extrusa TaxID=172846 RepID=A0AAV4RRH6_CAEEX|nr:hypothetical protein CEXT_262081 [Caerostris extrusa]